MTHPYLDRWLSGTTCHKPHIKREVLLENDTHIVLKHPSHAEYCGRGSGTKTCSSFAKLYDKEVLERWFPRYGGLFAPCLQEWTGRININRVREDCAQLGITEDVK